MWFFNELLWLFRRKHKDMTFQPFSLDPRNHDVRPFFDDDLRLEYKTDSPWSCCTSFTMWCQMVTMYTFFYTVIAFYVEMRADHGLTHTEMTSVLAASLMAHAIASTMWTCYKGCRISVRTVVCLASLFSAALTFVYVMLPGTATFISMVVLKGFLYGFIMCPTQNMVGHYLQCLPNSLMRQCLTVGVMVCPMLMLVSATIIMCTDDDVHGIYTAILVFELISCVLNFVYLSRTFLSRKSVTLPQMMEVLQRAVLNSPANPISENAEDREGRRVFMKQMAQPSEPSGISTEFLDLFGTTRRHADNDSHNVNTEAENGSGRDRGDLRHLSAFRQWLHPYTVYLFNLPRDDAWLFTYPKVRWAVLGQGFLRASLLFPMFYPSLCKEFGLATEYVPFLFCAMNVSFVVTTMLFFGLSARYHLFRLRTLVWVSAIATGLMCREVDFFNGQTYLALFGVAIGAFGLVSIGLSVEHIGEFYEREDLGSAVEVEALLGTIVLCLFIVINGVVLDHKNTFTSVYTLTGGFVILGAIPIFGSWLQDLCLNFYRYIRARITLSCCPSAQDDDEEKRPLSESFPAI